MKDLKVGDAVELITIAEFEGDKVVQRPVTGLIRGKIIKVLNGDEGFVDVKWTTVEGIKAWEEGYYRGLLRIN